MKDLFLFYYFSFLIQGSTLRYIYQRSYGM